MKSYFIPNLSSKAGSCLTALDWEHTGVEIASFWMRELLTKPSPGIEFLKTLPSLASFMGWSGRQVLNASLSRQNSTYVLTSSYDGSRQTYQAQDLLTLMTRLEPHLVILPQGFCQENPTLWQSLPETILPFFPFGEVPKETGTRLVGVYFEIETFLAGNHHTKLDYARPTYVCGEIDTALLRRLWSWGVMYVESNKPAQDGYDGVIEDEGRIISITDEINRMDNQVIEPHCGCDTCASGFTRAYLHHLFQHTPLLCQRFLIQHHVFQNCHLPSPQISL